MVSVLQALILFKSFELYGKVGAAAVFVSAKASYVVSVRIKAKWLSMGFSIAGSVGGSSGISKNPS